MEISYTHCDKCDNPVPYAEGDIYIICEQCKTVIKVY
jgi:hypothetical protein